MMDADRTYESLNRQIDELKASLNSRQEEVKNIKHSFLSYISHEIRTPMHAIMGFSELLANDNLSSGEREEYTVYIQECCKNLLCVFENMMDAATIHDSDLQLFDEEVEINGLMDELYNQFRIQKHRAEKYGVAFLVNKEFKDEEFWIFTDRARLIQVLTGLIENALKFTSKGVVEFGYYITEEISLHFYVADSGQGGLARAGQLLLENFNGNPGHIDGMSEESPLGIKISKAIIEAMDGKIWVEPNSMKGSTFCFTIPLRSTKKNIREVDFTSRLKKVI